MLPHTFGVFLLPDAVSLYDCGMFCLFTHHLIDFCFHFLTDTWILRATMNVHIQISVLGVYLYFVVMVESGITESNGEVIDQSSTDHLSFFLAPPLSLSVPSFPLGSSAFPEYCVVSFPAAI